MHIIDMVQNCVEAGGTQVSLIINENITANKLTITIIDNGRGIPHEMLTELTSPFVTTRTTRKVGLGIPLLDMVSRQSGGKLTINSTVGQGTTISADFEYHHLDRPPLGDIVGTLKVLVVGYYEKINFNYQHIYNDQEFEFSTAELKEALGDISFSQPEVLGWLSEFLTSNISILKGGRYS